MSEHNLSGISAAGVNPGFPVMTTDTLRAGVDRAHQLGKTVIAHAMTVKATEQALEIGVNGLAHLFVDQAASSQS